MGDDSGIPMQDCLGSSYSEHVKDNASTQSSTFSNCLEAGDVSPPPAPRLRTIPLPELEPIEDSHLGGPLSDLVDQQMSSSPQWTSFSYDIVPTSPTTIRSGNALGLELLPPLEEDLDYLQQLPAVESMVIILPHTLLEVFEGLQLGEIRSVTQLLLWLIFVPFILAFVKLLMKCLVRHAFG
jgi:hypothetical protein